MERDFDALAFGEKFKCRKKSSGVVCRALKRHDDGLGEVFVFAPRRRRYGYYHSREYFTEHYTIIQERKTETAKWHDRVHKIISLMDENGLWTELRPVMEKLLSMTWEDHEAINRLYWDTAYGTQDCFDTDEWRAWFEKYPFLRRVGTDGYQEPDVAYLWEQSRAELKTMYFGKRWNKEYKERIAHALAEKQDLKLIAQAGYDVTFGYDAGKGKAWYFEEYRDCGNGHYYLALGEHTAWFAEND